ncbi:hypothetical protein EDB19DRAFT_1776233 [Suillus lakei]|nr:hypothetical protein EDB19DRAFT_1815802 [Suillus lakei]KAG1720592.1 hypothetical protein EDB19DRAFT_1776233 [Suillus lakei]
MLAMSAMLISSLSMIRWLHTDRHWAQEQLKQGGYFFLSYLLSIVTPIFFVSLSMNCFILAILIAGFSSPSTIARAVTVLWLVAHVITKVMVLTELVWKFTTSLKSR